MAMVGVAEEFLFRGVIAETLLEHFGTSRAGVWKACLLSGVLFGAAHLTNLSSSAPFGVLMQCAFSASLGALFAAIYFRTGNLWVTVFLHGAMDIASMLIGGLYGTTTLSESVSGYDASMLLTVVVYLLPVAFLLRKKEAAGGAAVLGSVHPKMRAAGKKILAICPAIWYTVPVTVVRGWEYARIPGKPFPAAVPLAHKIL